MEKQELFIKIEDYLDGKLPEAEAEAFEEQIAADPALAESVARQRLEREMMEVMLGDHIEGKLAEWENTKKKPGKPGYRNWPWLLLPAILTIAWLAWPTQPTEPAAPGVSEEKPAVEEEPVETFQQETEAPAEPAGEQNPEPAERKEPAKDQPIAKKSPSDQQLLALAGRNEVPPVFVSGSFRGSSQADFKAASDALEDGKTDEAIRLFSQLAAAPTLTGLDAANNLAYLFYQKKDFQKAIPHFQTVAGRQDYDYQEQAEWMLALCYLTTRQFSKLNPLLTEISTNQAHRYAAKARKLKEEVNSMQ